MRVFRTYRKNDVQNQQEQKCLMQQKEWLVGKIIELKGGIEYSITEQSKQDTESLKQDIEMLIEEYNACQTKEQEFLHQEIFLDPTCEGLLVNPDLLEIGEGYNIDLMIEDVPTMF